MYLVGKIDSFSLQAPAQIQSHIARLVHFPLTPAAALLIEQILLDPTRHDDFTQLVNCDPVLMANLLRNTRTPYAQKGMQPDRLNPATDPLLRALLLAWTLEVSDLGREQQEVMEQFKLHSLRTAVLCRKIAAHTLPTLEVIAYQAGLLHDLGKALLLQLNWREVARLYKGTLQSGGSIYQGELLAWNYTHAHAGQWLLEAWHLPESICLALGAHHQPELMTPNDGEATRLAYMVHLANYLDQRTAGLIHEPVQERLDDKVWEIIDLNPSALDQLVQDAEREITVLQHQQQEFWQESENAT